MKGSESGDRRAAVQRALLTWYGESRRTLPWRERPEPYRVWLSEIMLQQTRVDTVLPYFERFTTRWSDVGALAAASEEEVVSEWAGLGYYSRARSLHKAAKVVAAAGAWPDTVAGLKALPGVGDYTAGAIASIAFGADAETVDGNIERVLSRLDGLTGDPRSTEGRRAVWASAKAWLPAGRAGDWNQALMDLGARVCTPKKPGCGACPASAGCRGLASGIAETLPRKKKKAPPTPIAGVCGALTREGGLLIVRRPPEGLLAGMWELPGVTLRDGEGPREGLHRAFGGRLGLTLTGGEPVGGITHVFTHRRLSMSVWRVEVTGEPAGAELPEWRWVAAAELESLGLSKLMRKCLDAAGFGAQQALFAGAAAEPADDGYGSR